MKRIYLCAQFKEQELMKIWRRFLHDHEFLVTSRWLDHTEAEASIANMQENLDKCNIDLIDIDAAEFIISHTLTRGDLFTGGGRHIEFGYALAKGKKLINVGGYENVFHFKAINVQCIEDTLRYLI